MSQSRILLAALLASFAFAAGLEAHAGPADQARTAQEAKDWEKAAGAWTEVLAKKPDDREAILGLVRAVVEGGLQDLHLPAEEALLRLLGAKPDDRDGRLLGGDLYVAIARSKSDPQAMQFAFDDARTHFQRLFDLNPADEEAVVGLARVRFWTADFDAAVTLLRDFLAEQESKGPADYWLGQVLYTKARDAYAAAGEMDDAARALFTEARDAYGRSVEADPARLDAWLQLGYASQYLGEVDGARTAYERAMDLDPEGFLPLKGIEALHQYEQDKYLGTLKDLARGHPTNVAVHFFLGFRQLFEKQYQDAANSFLTYQARSRNRDAAWTWLGQAWDGAGEADKAMEAFRKALAVNPGDEIAASALDRRLQEKHRPLAARSPEQALAAAKDYEALFRQVPQNAWVRNNLAFLLRDAIDRNQGDAAWRPVLRECLRVYVEAARLVEDEIRGREAVLPFARRYECAGVINDAGLMFHYYPEVRDVEKAEAYYIRALQLTDDGYADAFGNLFKLYVDAGRWQEAYDLARDCSQALKNADGTPHAERSTARQVMERLVREGKVSGD